MLPEIEDEGINMLRTAGKRFSVMIETPVYIVFLYLNAATQNLWYLALSSNM